MFGLNTLIKNKETKIKINFLYFFAPFFLFVFLFSCSLIFFASAAVKTSSDAIAIRVIPNPEHYSPLRWYKNKGFKGSPQTLTVDGYEAIRDGRTVYVNASNINTSTNKLFTNIYLISFNQDAESATEDIFGRLLFHWKFNTNFTEPGNCSEPVLTDSVKSDCAGTVGCWHFDEDFKDSSGNGNNGTAIGGIPFADGIIKKSVISDGVDDSVNFGAPAIIFPTSAISVSIWLKLNKLPNNESDISQHVGGALSRVYMRMNFNNKVYFAIADKGSAVSSDALEINKWYQLTGTYDGNFIKIYINGNERGSLAASGSINWGGSNDWYAIAGATGGTGARIEGLFDELKIYSRALSPTEISEEYYKFYKSCLTDSECKNQSFCQSLKSRITRDTKRLSDIAEMKIALNQYWNSNSKFPALSAGSYITGKTLSTWPSWEDTLSKELNAGLPEDPINKLGNCTGYDTSTCWNEKTKKFFDPTNNNEFNLPDGSTAYVYQIAANGKSYNLCANMESGLITEDSGNCAGNIIDNIPPVIVEASLPFTKVGGVFNGYFLASNPDGDILSWSIDASLANWSTWSGSSAPILKKVDAKNRIELYSPKAGVKGPYNIKATVKDGRGGEDTKSYTIMIDTCKDNDGDGFAVEGGDCGTIDCDDKNNNKAPGKSETCDGSDNNCNGKSDEGCDDDLDGYCDSAIKMYNNNSMCPKTFFKGNNTDGDDCDDSNKNINPAGVEICDNSIDEDCKGGDLLCSMVCHDSDGDGFGNPASAGCKYPELDCDDSSPLINLMQAEMCDNIDNNCSGATDETCNTDGDNYCSCTLGFATASNLSAICSGTNTTNNALWLNTCDCDDSNANIKPGAAEVCDNNIDDNCNGDVDCADSGCTASILCANCGDTLCVSGEDCNNCPQDCGACPATCPDGYCDPSCETAISCPADCSCAAGGLVWQIGDIEAGQMDDPADEFGLDYNYISPFVIGVNNNIDFSQGADFNDSKAINIDVNFNMAYNAQAELVLSWSPGSSGSEQKEILLNGISMGKTPVRAGAPVAGWNKNCKRFTDVIGPLNINQGLNTIKFKQLSGDGNYWDYIQLKIISCPACVAPPANMIGWWKGENNANDSKGTNNGSAINGANYSLSGEVGSAFNLSGASQWINIPNNSSLDFGTGDFTVDYWVNFSDTAGEQVIAEKYAEGMALNTHVGWSIIKMANNSFRFAGTTADSLILNTPVQTINANTWYNMAVRRSGQTFNVYWNSNSIGSVNINNLNLNSVSSLKIGHRGSVSDNPITPGTADNRGGFNLKGKVDEFQIYNRALTPAEIQLIYNAGTNGLCSAFNICKFPFTFPCVLQ